MHIYSAAVSWYHQKGRYGSYALALGLGVRLEGAR